jgi:zinc protease
MNKYGTRFVECYQGVWVFQLANGLQLILRPDTTTDSVVIHRRVGVGSVNECRGCEGGSHFFEHLNFACEFGEHKACSGTSFDDCGQIIGAQYNATTSRHGTAYWMKVAKAFLELALRMDSQRVRGLKLTERAKLSEMRVILNEMEQGKDRPGQVLYNKMYRTRYKRHPVRIAPIGNRKDVSNMTVKRLQWFYDKFYWPNNMVLIVAGNFDLEQALELVNRTYGVIPSSPKPIPVVDVIEPKQTQERRFVVRKVGALTQVMVGFGIPGAEDRDISKLWVIEDLLGASGAASGRLHTALLDTNKAVAAYANLDLGRDSGTFFVYAVVAQESSADEVIAIILAELEKLATGPITQEELEVVRKKATSFNTRVWADIQAWATSFIGRTVEYADWKMAADSLKNYLSVTAKQIRQAAGVYFQSENRTVGIYLPTKAKQKRQSAISAREDKQPLVEAPLPVPVDETCAEQKFDNLMELVQRYSQSQTKPETTLARNVQATTFDNGMFVSVMPKAANGMVAVSMRIQRAGHAYAGVDERQMPVFVADTLIAGTTEFTKDDIRLKLDRMAAYLDVSCGAKHVDISASVTVENLPGLLRLLKSLVRYPAFPEEELNAIKLKIGSALRMVMNNTKDMARMGLFSTLYTSESVLHPPSIAQTVTELQTATSADLLAFHKRHYIPQNVNVAMVGAVSFEDASELLLENFGDWTAAAPAEPPALPVVEPTVDYPSSEFIECNLPGKENTHVLFGHVIELSRQSKDYYAGFLSNEFLGGNTISGLLGKAVRGTGEEGQEKDGITYGIRSSFEGVAFGQPTWFIEADVNPAYVDDLDARVREVLARYKETGMKPHELARLKISKSWKHVQSLEMPAEIASKLSALGPRFAKIDEVPRRIQAVTIEQVQEFNRKNINPDELVVSIAGDLSVEQKFA